MNEREFKYNLYNYQRATGITRNRYFSLIYPDLHTVVNNTFKNYNIQYHHYYNDIHNEIIIRLLPRLEKININKINNIENYIFIMAKRLLINELQKINNDKLHFDDNITTTYTINYVDLDDIDNITMTDIVTFK